MEIEIFCQKTKFGVWCGLDSIFEVRKFWEWWIYEINEMWIFSYFFAFGKWFWVQIFMGNRFFWWKFMFEYFSAWKKIFQDFLSKKMFWVFLRFFSKLFDFLKMIFRKFWDFDQNSIFLKMKIFVRKSKFEYSENKKLKVWAQKIQKLCLIKKENFEKKKLQVQVLSWKFWTKSCEKRTWIIW